MSNFRLKLLGLTVCMMVCAGMCTPIANGSQPEVIADEIELRVPGMTKSFTLVRCPVKLDRDGASSPTIASLYVLNTEVTWDLYDIYLYKLDEPEEDADTDAISRPSKPYVPPDRGFGHDGYPAIGMTRHAAEEFCVWLSLKTGLPIRLPTQDEWTHLALGGSSLSDCCGSDPDTLSDFAWYSQNAEHSTHPVGLKTPNGFGLYDVHGNAAEWVMSDTRRPIALGGGYRDDAENCSADSVQKQTSSWNQSDPQIPKSRWWLADCSWVGFRFVIEAEQIDPTMLKEFIDDTAAPE